MADRALTVPLRLSEEERSMLRVLDGALAVSEYTDKVDVIAWRAKRSGLIIEQLADLCAVLSGLMLTVNRSTQKLIKGRQFEENGPFFQAVFEVGRRHKIMNPDKMRSNFGKLMFMLQDASQPDVQREMGFDIIRRVSTVSAELEDLGALELLEEPDLALASRSRAPADKADAKRAATARLLAKYAADDKPRAVRIERCILSMADDTALTEGHVRPVQQMLELLEAAFDRDKPERSGLSLQISVGRNGARLSHSHATQYAYVEQSLLLWREILSRLSLMWSLVEADMLDGVGYRLRDTGQGMHRVQSAPQVARFMHSMLGRLQSQVKGGWVGSAAVHLGDNDVPNALVWIDKYTQIPRILSPIIDAVRELDELAAAPGMDEYIRATFGTVDDCRKAILADFFKHGFDGSGADNYYDAGSCIDGRLTSAWNWCSKLEKKPYAHIFKMAGFVGFDGSFEK